MLYIEYSKVQTSLKICGRMGAGYRSNERVAVPSKKISTRRHCVRTIKRCTAGLRGSAETNKKILRR